MIDFYNEAMQIKDKLINWRRDFHTHPELGFKEFRTSQIIQEFLKNEGIDYYVTGNTGICGIIKGNGNKTIALRGDMDALPIQDKKNCSYSSKNMGIMHACGHDAHTTILMGAALLLNKSKNQLHGNVKLFFEPAEETTGGAPIMINEGVMNSPEVDAVIGLHVDEGTEVGKIAVKRGVVNAASNPFTIKIKGKGGHGAHPDTTIDPIVVASSIINLLQTIVSREIPPTSPAVITIGSIHAGTAQNIIPEEAVISGIIRTMKKEHREYVIKRVKELVTGVVESMRAQAEIIIEESYPCLYNNDDILDLVINNAESIVGKDNINYLEVPSMGVESFAYFSMNKPSAFYFLGCGNKEKGIINPAHGCYFDIDEDCLTIGAAIQYKAAYNFLNK